MSIPVEVTGDCAGAGGGVPLPGTGSDVPLWLVGLALALIASGATLLVAARRRRAG